MHKKSLYVRPQHHLLATCEGSSQMQINIFRVKGTSQQTGRVGHKGRCGQAVGLYSPSGTIAVLSSNFRKVSHTHDHQNENTKEEVPLNG